MSRMKNKMNIYNAALIYSVEPSCFVLNDRDLNPSNKDNLEWKTTSKY
jgi:hypothetical protein